MRLGLVAKGNNRNQNEEGHRRPLHRKVRSELKELDALRAGHSCLHRVGPARLSPRKVPAVGNVLAGRVGRVMGSAPIYGRRKPHWTSASTVLEWPSTLVQCCAGELPCLVACIT
eukprot:1332269-Rhodomonas_salina.1